MDDADLRNRFTYHAPTPDQIPCFEQIRDAGLAMARLIVELTPPGREQALAVTHLEETVMWANAAIARGEAKVTWPAEQAASSLPVPGEPSYADPSD